MNFIYPGSITNDEGKYDRDIKPKIRTEKKMNTGLHIMLRNKYTQQDTQKNKP